MKTKEEIQTKWITTVFDNLEKTEYNILRSIENSSFTDVSLEILRKEIQLHYGALNNLKKSFGDNTYFVGNPDIN